MMLVATTKMKKKCLLFNQNDLTLKITIVCGALNVPGSFDSKVKCMTFFVFESYTLEQIFKLLNYFIKLGEK